MSSSGLFAPEWLYVTVASGILGTITIASIAIHSMYMLKKEEVGTVISNALYIMFFVSGVLTCIGFALFRTDLILPMGTAINCHFGFYLTVNGVFLCKVLLFMIFMYRIDLAFHSSALAYPRSFLLCVMMLYFIITTVLNAIYIITVYPLIHLEQLPVGFVSDDEYVGICSTGGVGTEQQHSRRRLCLGLMFLGDIIFSLFVCSLFVYKLRVIIKMSKEDNNKHGDERNFKLVLLTRKQTILVIIACLTSLASLGIASQVAGFALLISVDITVNTMCVWLMFNFTVKIWNVFVKYICCCCYCCVYKEDFLITMRSLTSRKFSIRSRLSSHASSTDDAKKDNLDIDDHYVRSESASKGPTLSPIQEQHPVSPELRDIEINFENAKHIKSDDIKKLEENYVPRTHHKGDVDDDIEIKYDKEDENDPEIVEMHTNNKQKTMELEQQKNDKKQKKIVQKEPAHSESDDNEEENIGTLDFNHYTINSTKL